MITIEEFEERARVAFEAIPEIYRERVDGPHVEPDVHAHEHVPGSFVLGECHHHPDFTGDGSLFSSVVLYYGSFIALARRDPRFQIEEEITETVLHEVQHHLEDAVGENRLRDLDWAEDQNDRRQEGLPHQPRFWRGGIDLGGGLFRVGSDLFLELHLERGEWETACASGLEFVVGGTPFRVAASDIPAAGASVSFDWDWTDVPSAFASGEDHGHGHGPPSDWGDLVVDIRPRRPVADGAFGPGVS